MTWPRALSRAAGCLVLLTIATACVAEPTPAPSSPTLAPATATPDPTASPSPEATPIQSPSPTATGEPPLSLALPDGTDERRVSVDVLAELPDDGDGVVVVTVTSAADTRIDELVLRWPEELHATLFPAPFMPSDDRIREGGDPLVQAWTKWVIGPGERGEPAGTVSLGYGPLPAGGTLEIPLFVTRIEPGPVAFDLQVLAGEDLLTLENGEPAELRLEVP